MKSVSVSELFNPNGIMQIDFGKLVLSVRREVTSLDE